jgi:hypothetical protein
MRKTRPHFLNIMNELDYQAQLEEQEQEELEREALELRREEFQSWVNNCPEKVYEVDYDSEPSNSWWCAVHVKSDICLEED